MQSHAQINEERVINWKENLTQENPDWEYLQKLSGDWNTCSVGQMSSLIKRKKDKADPSPLDKKLEKIGLKFDKAVKKKDIEIALIWLERGKTRELVVLNKMSEKMTKKLELVNADIAELTLKTK